jgi:hypothetical protein
MQDIKQIDLDNTPAGICGISLNSDGLLTLNMIKVGHISDNCHEKK